MNREIKFRGWERELQMMVYDTELGGWHFEYDGNPVRAVNQMINEEDYFYDLMQYTGLKDKNGVEIYEGDIVQTGWQGGTKGSVVFNKDTYCVNTGVGYIFFNHPESYEVIGNIYEHPHLLESSE